MLKVSKKLLLVSMILPLVGCVDELNVPEVVVFKVKTPPNKTTYNAGNDFDPTGLTLSYQPNPSYSEIIVTVDDLTFRNDKNLTHGQNYIEVDYHGVTKRIDIEVSNVFEGQITCVGDSLTEGHNWPTESYPNFIKDYLDDSSLITVSNCGKNGASFKTFGQYNPAYNTTTQYQTSLTGNPNVLTILLGTNDATNWANEKDLYVQDYTDLVNLYRTTFGEDLNIIMLTSPRCLTNTFGIPSDTICDEVVPLQKQLVEDLNCNLIDLNAEFQNYSDSDLFRPNDGVHFTKKAAEITAKLIADEIKAIYELE